MNIIDIIYLIKTYKRNFFCLHRIIPDYSVLFCNGCGSFDAKYKLSHRQANKKSQWIELWMRRVYFVYCGEKQNEYNRHF